MCREPAHGRNRSGWYQGPKAPAFGLGHEHWRQSVKQPRVKLPGQGWTIKEKLEVAIALLTDRRFTYAERIVALTKVLCFHNTTTGDLYPSRSQLMELCRVSRS